MSSVVVGAWSSCLMSFVRIIAIIVCFGINFYSACFLYFFSLSCGYPSFDNLMQLQLHNPISIHRCRLTCTDRPFPLFFCSCSDANWCRSRTQPLVTTLVALEFSCAYATFAPAPAIAFENAATTLGVRIWTFWLELTASLFLPDPLRSLFKSNQCYYKENANKEDKKTNIYQIENTIPSSPWAVNSRSFRGTTIAVSEIDPPPYLTMYP